MIRQLQTAVVKIVEADLVISLFQMLTDKYDTLVTTLENILEFGSCEAEELKRTECHEDSGEMKLATFCGEKNQKLMKFQDQGHKCLVHGRIKKDCPHKNREADSAD